MTTTKMLLLEARMGGRSVRDLIASMRAEGASWQRIADVIHERSGIAVSRESLRNWTTPTSVS